MDNNKILVAEDDLNLGFLLMDFLQSEGFTVKLCRDGESAFQCFTKEKIDLCLLDVMMPKMDGFQLAQKIRQHNKKVPFIFLTAKSMKEDKLKGYATGADDYVTKPFDEEELLCKIRAILRRMNHENQEKLPTQFKIGKFFFDYERQELNHNGSSRRITQKENEVLRLLCLNRNKILRRDDAVEEIYGYSDYFLGRSFDVFISRIRKMLREDPNISIENVFKVGFILNVQDEAVES